jgi:tRNA (cytidine/uridine-2'-O-)-methyltransferase
LRLVFFQPDIPQNLGAGLRLAACFGVGIDLIEPCGFPLTDKALKRSAMDYAGLIEPVRHDGWQAFLAHEKSRRPQRRLVLLSTKAQCQLQDFSFSPDDSLILGRESAGVPDSVVADADASIRIPLTPQTRSFNVVMAAGIALYEGLRQTGALPQYTTGAS